MLGGVEIRSEGGLDGHSDADVLTHAVIDALLGAVAQGTIGELFPDSDERWRGASSIEMLAVALRLIEEAGWHVVNVDSVLVAEQPRLQPHLRAMADRLSACLRVDAASVGVKATSPERLGALGRGEGIAAQAVVLLERRP